MPLIRKEGKDTIIFASKEDHATPSTIDLPEPEPSPGLMLENGEINWNCPCLGGMATGPCGVEFREAFSCFHYSEKDPKGSDCYGAFKSMQTCMTQYPSLYGGGKENLDDLDLPDEDEEDPSNSEKKKEVSSSQKQLESNKADRLDTSKKDVERSKLN